MFFFNSIICISQSNVVQCHVYEMMKIAPAHQRLGIDIVFK